MGVSTELVRTLYTMAGLIDDTSDRAAGDDADATALATMMNRVEIREEMVSSASWLPDGTIDGDDHATITVLSNDIITIDSDTDEQTVPQENQSTSDGNGGGKAKKQNKKPLITDYFAAKMSQ